MSDEGEKTCPLCAEEMDLTDRQLKPCKCGYEICVWCWHQIMDMAEKDETEGKCPACRTPYNKEKIVGMAAKCERLVAEMNVERKVKSQKSKNKTCEGRKDLSSVRVIQRNLVYIVGLPLNLADEDLLQHREYFGQYGKVLKVSISRTAAGAIQHFPNDTCSVYITYSKEDEAVRCIQSVHGFTLEGRSLRACFGTTKYCHAWLRSVPCSNPDCLYLHEIGSQEDSFTKDEIISAYTRVQHITGATIDMQRRSGNMLPPPADEFCINGSSSPGKPTSKIVANNPASSVRGSPPTSSSGRSGSLPVAAAWGMRTSNSHPPASLACSNGPSKQKPDTCSGSLAISVAVTSPTQVSILHCDVGKNINEENQMTQQKGKLEQLEPMTRYMDIGKQINEENRATQQKGKLEQLEPIKQYMRTDHRGTASETPATPELPATLSKNRQFCTPVCTDRDKSINVPLNSTNSFDLSDQASGPGPGKDLNHATEAKIQNLCSNMLSTSIDRHRGLQRCDAKQSIKPFVSLAAERAVTSSKDVYITREPSDLRSDPLTQVAQAANHEVEGDLLSFDDRFKDPEVVTHQSYLPNLSQSFHRSNDSKGYPPLQAHGSVYVNVDPQVVDKEVDKGFLSYASRIPVISNGYPEYPASSSSDWNSIVDHSSLLPNEEKMKHVGRFEDEQAKVDCNAAVDMGESSIISNILSMDFDTWDESLTSPQNFAKLLGETDKKQGSLRLSSSRKVQNSSQSRFSFAREEECVNQVSDVEPSLSNIGQALKNRPYSHDLINNRNFHLDKLGYCNGLSSVCVEEPDNFSGSHSHISSNKFSVSRTQISAPPGFSGPSRAPPPGFTSHERMEQAFDTESGNHLLDTSFLLRKPYQAPPPVNIGSTGDIEFMDPAILAVGKGRLSSPGLDMRTNFPPQLNSYENEAKLQLLMQRSLSPHQNQRYTEMGDSFSNSSRTDAYGIPSRVMEQMFAHNLSSPLAQLSPPQSRNVLLSNGHWDGWNEVQSGNDLRMAQLLRNERLGFNKFYTGYEDSKFRTPSSADLYNRTFGI